MEGQSADILSSLLPLVALFAIFYFLIIRPQQKQAKAHKDMIAGLKKGDVITAINDTKVSTVADLKYQLYKYNVGDKVTVTFNRNGTEKTATATLTKNE